MNDDLPALPEPAGEWRGEPECVVCGYPFQKAREVLAQRDERIANLTAEVEALRRCIDRIIDYGIDAARAEAKDAHA